MIFDFEGRYADTPGLEPAMSWREQALLSLFLHLFVVGLILFIPQLEWVRQAEAERAARLAELAEQQAQAEAMAQALATASDPMFVFIEPLVEIVPEVAPRPDAPLSDRDRVAQSPTASDDPLNSLPNAEGNSSNFVISEDPQPGLNPDPRGVLGDAETPRDADPPDIVSAADVTEPVDDPLAEAETDEVTAGADGTTEDPVEELVEVEEEPEEPEEVEEELADAEIAEPEGEDLDAPDRDLEALVADGALLLPGSRGAPPRPSDPDPLDPRMRRPADGLVGRAMRDLDRYALRETFSNRRGDTGRFGPDIQFDSRGADFGPWVRRFIAQVRRNWFVPYAIMSRSLHGNVVLTFHIQRDGSMTDLTIVKPAGIEAFTNSAFNALATSNPTQPLPDDYPGDSCFFTVTFYFNEMPPV